MNSQILQGDCVEVMRTLAENSVDSIVTDPPYGIRFMGKAWDGADIEAKAVTRRSLDSHAPNTDPNGGHKSIAAEAGRYDRSLSPNQSFQVWTEDWAREALRVLKPGGYLLSFSSPRTYHRMVSGIEDAGFEIRDQILWVFGSGFPKSHNGPWGGTALKPAHEPIVVARKPLIGTVEQNWKAFGTGALNIDGCRIGNSRPPSQNDPAKFKKWKEGDGTARADSNNADARTDIGRWPANLIHDGSDEVLVAFPNAPGQLADAKVDPSERKTRGIHGVMNRGHEPSADSENAGAVGFKMRPGARRIDAGSAARFFYCAKASRADRNEGCADLPLKVGGMVSNTSGQHITRRDGGAPGPTANHHPTVKPTDLMRYLCRLVTPGGGTVLDPFLGSGSTGKAAVLEDFNFIGIELESDYLSIAEARIDFARKIPRQGSLQDAFDQVERDEFTRSAA